MATLTDSCSSKDTCPSPRSKKRVHLFLHTPIQPSSNSPQDLPTPDEEHISQHPTPCNLHPSSPPSQNQTQTHKAGAQEIPIRWLRVSTTPLLYRAQKRDMGELGRCIQSRRRGRGKDEWLMVCGTAKGRGGKLRTTESFSSFMNYIDRWALSALRAFFVFPEFYFFGWYQDMINHQLIHPLSRTISHIDTLGNFFQKIKFESSHLI